MTLPLRAKEHAANSCQRLDALVTAGRSVDSFQILDALVIAERLAAASLEHGTVGTLTDDPWTQGEWDRVLHGDQNDSLSPSWCTRLFSNLDK